MKSYAGIGSRETPPKILALLQELGYQAATLGWNLRSGAAPGADTAFEIGCNDAVGKKEIFLPWAGFNGSDSLLTEGPSSIAMTIAEDIHPAWGILRRPARMLVARNMHQIAGPNMDDPVNCVICYTPDGCESRSTYGTRTGGTGTAIAFASTLDIPIFNLCNIDRFDQALAFLRDHNDQASELS